MSRLVEPGGRIHENAMNDAIEKNAFLYTVSRISQDIALKTELARSGARKSNCRKTMYRIESRVSVIRSR